MARKEPSNLRKKYMLYNWYVQAFIKDILSFASQRAKTRYTCHTLAVFFRLLHSLDIKILNFTFIWIEEIETLTAAKRYSHHRNA